MSAPEELKALKEQVRRLADVERVGFTMRDGRWILAVWLRKGVPSPLPGLGFEARGFEIVYGTVPGRMPVARPAFPRRGE